MNPNALILPLAILGLSGTAFAAGAEGDSFGTLDTTVAFEAALHDEAARHTTSQTRGGAGGKSATRTTTTSRGGKQAQRITYSNGNRTATTTRGRATTTQATSHYGANGDRMHKGEVTTQYRRQNTMTNGTKTSTQREGMTVQQTRRQGVDGGDHFRDRSTEVTHRTADRMTNGRGGEMSRSSRTTSDHDVARRNGQVVQNRTVVTHSGRPTTTTRPLATPGRPPAARPSTVRPSTVRPSPVRPSTVRPSTGHRPANVVVHHGRPSTTVVRPHHTTVVRPSTRVVTYRTVRPYHGVFVYGPRPVHHVHYVDASPAAPAQVQRNHMPRRELDRADSVAVGLKTGSLVSGYNNGQAYGDLGLGIAGRYRPAESVGLQVDLTHHTQSWTVDTERSQTLAAGSVQLFAFPWTKVSPYAIGGVTYDARNIQDDIAHGNASATVIANDALWGLHGGLGLELAMGKSLALDLEGRYIGYLDKSPTDPSAPGALQLTAGLMFHF